MAVYPYRCSCGHAEDVVKPIRDCDEVEICRKCHQPMTMNYGDPAWAKVGAAVFKGHFNVSLGRYIGSQADIREAQHKIEDATGSRPVELGNERPKLAPPKHEVDMREVLAYAEQVQKDRGETVNNG